jgi:3-deoxy-D-manno-octulosonic-acid transferase
MGALLTDSNERASVVASARQTIAGLSGALDRTLAALDPYLMQLRLERRDSHA